MDEQQARDVLGLDPTSSDADVVDAHRRLMQKLHPDKGGSAYLAQQLNEAKRVLLQK
jgi:curved DNA-binding protein CbpA